MRLLPFHASPTHLRDFLYGWGGSGGDTNVARNPSSGLWQPSHAPSAAADSKWVVKNSLNSNSNIEGGEGVGLRFRDDRRAASPWNVLSAVTFYPNPVRAGAE